MDKVFGISMNAIMVTFIILLVICLSVTLYVAVRNRVVFLMGVRNIPRHRAQTVLIVVGLMLSTLISTASLGMGDTIDTSIRKSSYGVLGPVDEVIEPSAKYDDSLSGTLQDTMPESTLQAVDQTLAPTGLTDGTMSALVRIVPAINGTNNLSTPTSFLIGIDPAGAEQLGGLRSTSGDAIDITSLPDNQVVISDSMAKKIDAKPGDVLTIYNNNAPMQLTVSAIAEDSPLSGVLSTSDSYGLVVPLARLQAATGNQGKISFIAVSNTGDNVAGLTKSDRVYDALRPALDGQGIGVSRIKQQLSDQSASISSGLTGLFLVLGLFSIAVGVLLIILIFSMLAAERRPEMGMARAVGQQRRHLIQQFIAEGSGYALLSGLVGAAIGTGIILILARILSAVIGDSFPITGDVTPRSIIVGYCLGVIMTFLAIVVASIRASQLNVVAAIRDLPDRSDPKRKLRTLLTSALMLIVGFVMILAAYGGSGGQTFLFSFGMSLLPFGVAGLGRWFGIPSRPLYSLVGIYLLVFWFMPADTQKALFGSVVGGGGFEMFFLIGVFAVAGATILIVQNIDVLLWLFRRIGSVFGSRLPAIRLAIAYPGSNPGRTGLTVAMFSLIVFSLVAFATIFQNFNNIFISDKAAAGYDIQVVVPPGNQLPNQDLVAALNARGADTSDIAAVGMTSLLSPAAPAQQLTSPDPKNPPTKATDETIQLSSFDKSYLQTSTVSYQGHAAGYADDSAIRDALANEPDVAVITTSSLQGQGGGFGGPAGLLIDGLKPQQNGFEPVQVRIQGQDGQPQTVRIIGIIDQDVSPLTGLYVGQATGQQLYPTPQSVSYDIKLTDPDNADERAKQMGSALLQNGAEADSWDSILKSSQAIFSGFLLLIQGFMGLGLIVGIAAVGVIAFRSVIERRQQIGMLRAIGYARSMVSLSFMVETVFVVGLGVISGTIMALVTAWELFQDPAFTGSSGSISITIPWGLVAAVLAITFGFALLMTWLPSRQAGRVMPAQALRYE